MPPACPVETAKNPSQPGKLHGLPHYEAGQYRQHAQSNYRRICLLLERVIGFPARGLRAEKEIVPHHRPDSTKVARHEEDLPMVPGEELVSQINQSRNDINPGK